MQLQHHGGEGALGGESLQVLLRSPLQPHRRGQLLLDGEAGLGWWGSSPGWSDRLRGSPPCPLACWGLRQARDVLDHETSMLLELMPNPVIDDGPVLREVELEVIVASGLSRLEGQDLHHLLLGLLQPELLSEGPELVDPLGVPTGRQDQVSGPPPLPLILLRQHGVDLVQVIHLGVAHWGLGVDVAGELQDLQQELLGDDSGPLGQHVLLVALAKRDWLKGSQQGAQVLRWHGAPRAQVVPVDLDLQGHGGAVGLDVLSTGIRPLTISSCQGSYLLLLLVEGQGNLVEVSPRTTTPEAQGNQLVLDRGHC